MLLWFVLVIIQIDRCFNMDKSDNDMAVVLMYNIILLSYHTKATPNQLLVSHPPSALKLMQAGDTVFGE